MAPLRLRHLHLPSIHPHYIPYRLASRVQEHIRRQHLDFKDGSAAHQPPPPPPPPPPTLISFTPSPIYTLGRRQTAPLTPSEAARLTAPLQIPGDGPDGAQNGSSGVLLPPELLHSPRGGLTTYHGPGQVVLWPVLDLKSPHHRNFSVKCYARLLETTTIATLHSLFGIDAFSTDDPGVWVRPRPSPPPSASASPVVQGGQTKEDGEGEEEERAKIAALGVHLRRHVTALGTAVNVAMPGPEVADERVNPWARIVACGLAGRGVTSVRGETSANGEVGSASAASGGGVGGKERLVAGAWADELAQRIGLGEGGVEVVETGEVVRLMEGLLLAAGEAGDETREERGYLERVRGGL